ncbi:unnamed protein product [Tuber melanosporum]|uniref:rRNA-processing protein n=1 Tax=Tuber melanosporum (strain Mel28) TaxID=656061 RepID=D5GH75_TUBMM|nr:uncharacterized protein GSTUM_00007780001 [Tuber melanosporum]KAG0131232.1 hypothetical protein HOY82DRAFT_485352 [Tuber indicum]CAZ83900.1 unnamed protein product [Tuber melanosporum]
MASAPETAVTSGARKNGKSWKPTGTAFRPKAGASRSWGARLEQRKALAATKEAKVEKERYERLAEKMHVKRVERIRRRERRNKVLKER